MAISVSKPSHMALNPQPTFISFDRCNQECHERIDRFNQSCRRFRFVACCLGRRVYLRVTFFLLLHLVGLQIWLHRPLIGGSLSKPAERFPENFRSAFWKEYPYFLPCLAASSLVLLTSFLVLLLFKEASS